MRPALQPGSRELDSTLTRPEQDSQSPEYQDRKTNDKAGPEPQPTRPGDSSPRGELVSASRPESQHVEEYHRSDRVGPECQWELGVNYGREGGRKPAGRAWLAGGYTKGTWQHTELGVGSEPLRVRSEPEADTQNR